MLSLYISRQTSVAALNHPSIKNGAVFMVPQRNQATDAPLGEDLYAVGTIGRIVRTIKLSDGRYKVLIQGLARAKATKVIEKDGVLLANLGTVQPSKPSKLSSEDRSIVDRVS